MGAGAPNSVLPEKIKSFLCKYFARSIRKYSCSAPTEGVTFVAVVFLLNRRTIRIACVESASMERKSGVFLSSASPLKEQNAVGMHRITPVASSFKNAGEVMSHTV